MGAKEQYSPASLSLLSKDSRRAIKAGGGHTAQSIHAFATKEKYNNIALLQQKRLFWGLKGITTPSIERQKYICGRHPRERAGAFSAPFDCAALEGNALLTRLTRTWPEPFIPARRFPSCRTIKSCSLPFTQLWPTAQCAKVTSPI